MSHIFRRLFSTVSQTYVTPSLAEVRAHLKRLVKPHRAYLSGVLNPDLVTEIKRCTVESQDELEPRTIKDSFCEALIPLAFDESLREEYRNFANNVRTGRILEDLDTMAVNIAYHYNTRDTFLHGERFSSLAIVTAAVDSIHLTKPFVYDRNIKLSGHVCYVGKSSCSIHMNMQQEVYPDDWTDMLHASFVLVARNPLTNGPAVMNPLVAGSEEEKSHMLKCKDAMTRRKNLGKELLVKNPPNAEESELIHNMYLNSDGDEQFSIVDLTEKKAGKAIFMGDTVLKNAFICEPQQRNIYNKLFGGFLMRKSYDLAWAGTRIFSKMIPTVQVIGDVTFHKPVEIGSILFFSSVIAYVNANKILTRVKAELINPDTGTRSLTNTLYFIFETPQNAPLVIPKSYNEYMIYLDGKRRFEQLERL